jgi:hypothetical protein
MFYLTNIIMYVLVASILTLFYYLIFHGLQGMLLVAGNVEEGLGFSIVPQAMISNITLYFLVPSDIIFGVFLIGGP